MPKGAKDRGSSATTPITSPPPEEAQQAPPVGIDFGSEYCCVAYCKDGRGETIANEDGERTTPSVVAFDSEEKFAGTAAKAQLVRNRTNTVHDFKTMLGKRHDELEHLMKQWPFRTVAGPDGKVLVHVDHKEETVALTAEELTATMLERMRDTATVVLTVPQHFSVAQRAALRSAAEMGMFADWKTACNTCLRGLGQSSVLMRSRTTDDDVASTDARDPRSLAFIEVYAHDRRSAGLKVLRLLTEPVAAALAMNNAQQEEADRLILVIDIGASLKTTVVLSAAGIYRVLTHMHEPAIGGREFDEKLVQHFAAEFKRKTKLDVKESERALTKLRLAAESTKRALSQSTTAPISVESLHEGEDLHSNINRPLFDTLTGVLVSPMVATVGETLKQAGIEQDDIDQVILMGGMASNAKVRNTVSALFDGKDIKVDTFPDETAAAGAAIEAALLVEDEDTADVTVDYEAEIMPQSLWVAGADGKLVRLLRAGAPLPARRTRSLAYPAGQASVLLALYAGESPAADSNRMVAQARLAGLPTTGGQVDLVVQTTMTGEVTVTAQEPKSRTAVRIALGVQA